MPRTDRRKPRSSPLPERPAARHLDELMDAVAAARGPVVERSSSGEAEVTFAVAGDRAPLSLWILGVRQVLPQRMRRLGVDGRGRQVWAYGARFPSGGTPNVLGLLGRQDVPTPAAIADWVSPLARPGAADQDWRHRPVRHGRLVTERAGAGPLPRPITVYRPPGLLATRHDLPLVVLFDGEAFAWFAAELDEAIAAGGCPPSWSPTSTTCPAGGATTSSPAIPPSPRWS
ncbi:hypothetical protein [Nonomuraea sp. SYSU D8015]|uniref:hypothetical protein n=1 Tax=Nonomuraea sp. SYSU D8015 TaxID=2593644 RepID=UPI0016616F44|nr:hypothetical protein [Nonomuraea sp. SYSU D8015]